MLHLHFFQIFRLSRIVKLSTHHGSPYLRKIPFTSPTSPSLLWLQLFVRYYAGTNRGHNFLVREEFTVCMWELHRKRKRYMTAGVPAPISTMEIHTQMVNDLPTYYGLCCASVDVSIRVVDQTNPDVSLWNADGFGVFAIRKK